MGKNNHGHHGRRKPSKPDLSKEAEAEAKAKASAGPEGHRQHQGAAPQDTTAPATEGADKEARWKEASDFAAQVQAEEEAQAAALSPEETEAAATAALNPSARAWTPPSVPAPAPVAAQDDAGRAEALRMSEARKAAKEAELSGKADKEAGKAVTEEQVRAYLGGAVQPHREAWEDKAESEELLEVAAAAAAGAKPVEVEVSTSSGTGAESAPSSGSSSGSGSGSSGGGDASGGGFGLGWGLAAAGLAVAVVFVLMRRKK